ncbi:Aminopeptidase N [Schistosoma japonicum]|nr:Aminopeptidase N [Schistosoma japonicum]
MRNTGDFVKRRFDAVHHHSKIYSMHKDELQNTRITLSTRTLHISTVMIFAFLLIDVVSAVSHFSHNFKSPLDTDMSRDGKKHFYNHTEIMLGKLTKDFRLPHTIFPLSYDLLIQVHLNENNSETSFFNGSVTINVYCNKSTSVFFVHAYKNLNVNVDEVHFQSDLDTNGEGFYLGKYLENGTYKYFANTLLEPTFARRVFPCWDEPGFKAQFRVSLIYPKRFRSLSNMDLAKSEILFDEWRLDTYNPTVKMSTYMLAFVISQFLSIQKTDSKGRSFNVWTRPERIYSAGDALEIGMKLLTYFEDYFGIPYPLPKMDMVAIPSLLVDGSESWGLITFNEHSLLWNPETDLEYGKFQMISYISHELAHQYEERLIDWFGNLVTMNWWNTLWLNEGFANYFGYVGVKFIAPEWKTDELFFLYEIRTSLDEDSSRNTHPLNHPVNTTSQIEELFDIITYNKGASIISMMEKFMGETAFINGVKEYLRRNQYGNADEMDLWNAMSDAWNRNDEEINIGVIMNTWTKGTNYPLVIVHRNDSNVFYFQQIHYFVPIDNNSVSLHEYSWKIPITYKSAETNDWGDVKTIWMMNNTMNETLDIEPSGWYLLNVNQSGFYRVHYGDNNWLLLIKQLQTDFTAIPVYSRSQILDDLFSLANRDTVYYTHFLDATKYLHNEKEFIVWKTASRGLLYVNSMLRLNENYGLFQAYLRKLIDGHIKSVNWEFVKEDQDLLKLLLRNTLVKLACIAEHQICINKTSELFSQWMEEPEKRLIPPGLRYTVYCTGIRLGGINEWTYFRDHLPLNDGDFLDNEGIFKALACSHNSSIMKQYFDWIRDTDSLWYVLEEFSESPVGNAILWDYLSNSSNFNQYPSFTTYVFDVLSTHHYAVYNEADKKLKFLSTVDHGNNTFQGGINDLIKKSEENLIWYNDNIRYIIEWLEETVPEAVHSS